MKSPAQRAQFIGGALLILAGAGWLIRMMGWDGVLICLLIGGLWQCGRGVRLDDGGDGGDGDGDGDIPDTPLERSTCRYSFRSQQCGYRGIEHSTCGKSLADCRDRGRLATFGGWPGEHRSGQDAPGSTRGRSL